MTSSTRVLVGAGTFDEKVYTYPYWALSVKDVQKALPDSVEATFVWVENSPPAKQEKARRRLRDAIRGAGAQVEVVPLEEVHPDPKGFWRRHSRYKLAWIENWFRNKALHGRADAYLSWEIDCIPGPAAIRRLPVWLDRLRHPRGGPEVLHGLMPINPEESIEDNWMIFRFPPQQLRVDEPVEVQPFVRITHPDGRVHQERVSRKRVAYYNRVKRAGAVVEGKLVWRVSQPKPIIEDALVWAVAQPRPITATHAKRLSHSFRLGRQHYLMVGFHPRRVLRPFSQRENPRVDGDFIPVHGGHLGFSLLPREVLRETPFRYKAWVHNHPDMWFALDAARKNIRVLCDLRMRVNHLRRDWRNVLW